MRTIAIGDTHGRSFWKIPFYNEEWDHFIFIGDYYDSFDISTLEQISNFRQIVTAKRESEKPVDLLIGNHDLHYFPEIGHTGTSGYQRDKATDIEYVINEHRDELKMATFQDDILFTHAGVGEAWMEALVRNGFTDKLPDFTAVEVANWVNKAWQERWASETTGKPYNVFNFTGRDPSGNNMGQTPVWIRPLSLTKDTHEMRKTIKQVVGHTGQHKIDLSEVSTLGGKYFFIDTLGTSGEYLIIEDGKFSTGKVK